MSLPGDERTIRGYSAVDLLIVDEAARVEDALINAVRPMLAVSGGRIIAASTPFGQRGWFHAAATDPAAGWDVVTVSADECPRITPEFLATERASLGDWWYRQEYECTFVDSIGSVFSGADIAAIFAPDAAEVAA